jgi:hypothetical protein
MAKITEESTKDLNLNENDESDDGLAPDDYVFIIGANGKMKSVIFPAEESFGYSSDLLKVFKAVGVDNPDSLLDTHTLH